MKVKILKLILLSMLACGSFACSDNFVEQQKESTINLKEKVTYYYKFSGFITYSDGSKHYYDGVFVFVVDDHKLVDMTFMGFVDGKDGTYGGFLVKSDNNGGIIITLTTEDGKTVALQNSELEKEILGLLN